jgi:acyl dehydratase
MAIRELNSSPGMLPMFVRAGAAMVPGSSLLPFVGGGGSEVPDLTLTLEGIEIDRERLAAYDRVCGFDLRDELPPTYPHMLAFPLHLALMTDGSFPFPAIGLVHIVNRIVQHRPVRATEKLSLRVWASPVEPHPRGRQFSLRTEARVGEDLVWEEVSTNLKRGRGSGSESGGGSGSGSGSDGGSEIASSEELPAAATWELPGDLGRRYASVSGDFNPIHVHWLTARVFGFPSAIAHGMWTKARCLAALEPRLPDAFSVEVAFRKPILLPARVVFAHSEGEGEVRFGVRDAKQDTPHLNGRVTSA